MLLLVIAFVSLSESRSWLPPVWDESCMYTRDDVYKCLKKYVDVNPKDNQITKKEIDDAMDKYMSTWMKPLFWLSSGSEGIMENCDADHNGVITPRDWEESKDKCLPFKRNFCSVQWFCEGAEEEEKNGKK
jgi:hypothetical protein